MVEVKKNGGGSGGGVSSSSSDRHNNNQYWSYGNTLKVLLEKAMRRRVLQGLRVIGIHFKPQQGFLLQARKNLYTDSLLFLLSSPAAAIAVQKFKFLGTPDFQCSVLLAPLMRCCYWCGKVRCYCYTSSQQLLASELCVVWCCVMGLIWTRLMAFNQKGVECVCLVVVCVCEENLNEMRKMGTQQETKEKRE